MTSDNFLKPECLKFSNESNRLWNCKGRGCKETVF